MQRKVFWATIEEGGTISNEIVDVAGYALAGVIVPANWTAGDISFIATLSAYEFPVYDIDGAQYVIDAVAGAFHAFPPNITLPALGTFKVVSAVTQTGAAKKVGLVGVIA